MESLCVFCGCEVPEGYYVCPMCEHKLIQGTIKGQVL